MMRQNGSMKTCKKCLEEKPIDCFYQQKNQKDGHNAWCKSCVNRHRKAGRESQKVQHRRRVVAPEVSQVKRLRRHYITDEKFIEMLEAADGRCESCGNLCEDLFIDHCHKTKQVRGLLCHGCNTGLGCFKDDPERLKRAIAYLRRTAA